jgi:hypothetical protein
MGKKESTDRRLNRACRLSVTPSSRSSTAAAAMPALPKMDQCEHAA